MLIIDETLFPLIAVLTLLDELARLRKFRNLGDLSASSAFDRPVFGSVDPKRLIFFIFFKKN